MIYFGNAQGDITKIISEPIYQGSNNASDIVFIAPFSAVTVCVAFVLPNGIITKLNIMNKQVESNMSEIGLQDCDLKNSKGTSYNAWRYLVDASLTEYAGVVKVQFYVFAGSSTILSTYTTTFNVQKGVKPTLPTPLDSESVEYNRIYQYLTGLNQDLANATLIKTQVTLAELQALLTVENAARIVVIQPKDELNSVLDSNQLLIINMLCSDLFVINANGSINQTKQIFDNTLIHNVLVEIGSNSKRVINQAVNLATAMADEPSNFSDKLSDTYFNFYIYK